MKKLYNLVIALFMCLCASSQVVTIPDANFKATLLSANAEDTFIAQNLAGIYFRIDANNDGEIQLSEASQVSSLYLSNPLISSVEGISSFINLQGFQISGTNIQNLNVSGLASLSYLSVLQGVITVINADNCSLEELSLGLSATLQSLSVAHNNLTELYAGNFPNLTYLDCSFNDIGVLNLTNFPSTLNLQTLNCSNNNLSSLNVSGLTNLITLDCGGNQLATLNVNSLIGLQNLNCSDNLLTSLLIKNGVNEVSLNFIDNPGLLYVCADETQIASVQSFVTNYGYVNCDVDALCSSGNPNVVVIPDAAFKARLLESSSSNQIAKNLNDEYFAIDSNNDSEIQVSEAMQVSYLDMQRDFSIPNSSSISSLEGILSFGNLKQLNCSNNNLVSLNVSGMSNLIDLDCGGNQLTTMNLTGLVNLHTLNCGGAGNQFGSLNLTNLISLSLFNCTGNGMTSLNVNGLTNLETLICRYNNFTTLNVSSLTNLQTLVCSGNYPLTSLDVTGLTNLQELECSDNGSLQELICSQNQLTSLNLIGLPNLATVEITNNLLTTLDVNHLTGLQNLNCSGNQLTSLSIKNGVDETSLNFDDNPGLLHVCADAGQIAAVQSLVTSYGYVNCVVDALCSSGNPNVVVIPDSSFKATLLQSSPSNQIAKNLSGEYFAIDANNDSEIQQSEAEQVSSLDVKFSGIASMEGILSFTNLNYLNCRGNMLTELHLGGLTNLQVLRCSNNWITVLDLVGISNLLELHCSNNRLTAINAEDFPNLVKLHCDYNYLTTLNVSSLIHLQDLHCSVNQLQTLFIKNGMAEQLEINSNPELVYICADDFQLDDVLFAVHTNFYTNCTVNSYCSFTPGGTFYTVNGNNRIDSNLNGCDVTDLPLSNGKFIITSGTNTETVIANATGLYSFPVEEGTHTITPVLENPSFFTITPSSASVNFPTQNSPLTQDFCWRPIGVHYDLEVSMIPTNAAIPGFSATYGIIFKNKGTQTQSGTVTIFFDETSSLQSLPLTFTDLKPLETRAISSSIGLNTPTSTPPLNAGDVLNYMVTITSNATDETPEDNTFILNQTVVNSFDPNDKTCLEGATISPGEVGKYMHYMIRFENTGTYQAQNIVVKDMIDTNKFDVSSLVPIKGSHDFITRIKDSKVEFIFENVNLPFDDANNDGYVVFKIKTKPNLVNGDTFSNSASIYFDYNFPVETNTAITTIQALKAQDFSFSDYFMVYPNPVKDVLTIEASHEIKMNSVSIYNQLGQLVLVIPNAQNVSKVDVSSLSSGNYFIKINSDKGTSNTKFIKQ